MTKIVLHFQSEGMYEAVVSVFNPLDGWVSSRLMKIEVLEEAGPISIEDGPIITDKVLKETCELKYFLIVVLYFRVNLEILPLHWKMLDGKLVL